MHQTSTMSIRTKKTSKKKTHGADRGKSQRSSEKRIKKPIGKSTKQCERRPKREKSSKRSSKRPSERRSKKLLIRKQIYERFRTKTPWQSKTFVIGRVRCRKSKMTLMRRTYFPTSMRPKWISHTSTIRKSKLIFQKLSRTFQFIIRLKIIARLLPAEMPHTIQRTGRLNTSKRSDKWTRRNWKWRPSCSRTSKLGRRRHWKMHWERRRTTSLSG